MRSDLIKNKSLLSSQARIQVPWVKVTIGDYTFGIFDEKTKNWGTTQEGFYEPFKIQYPQYVQSLEVAKINGQINKYKLTIVYPITIHDDPNFFEKVFSSVSRSRKIIFSYGDAETPAHIYRNEEAIITTVSQSFNLESCAIQYDVEAVSSASLYTDGSITKPAPSKAVKPSDEIKKLFKENKSLQNTFTGMKKSDLESFIPGDDKAVEIESRHNISAIDYINYLVSCMVPAGSGSGLSTEIYILTINDSSLDDDSNNSKGPYFEVKKVSTVLDHSEAYEIDIGINTSTIVRNFTIEKNENYSIYYEYQNLAHPKEFVRRIGADGQWEDIYAPTSMSRPNSFKTTASDKVWWTKATQFPISARITIQGLLRPATLMQYVRLNVIFPGGKKHLASGLYIVTRQTDNIGTEGYTTTLGLTRIKGDQDTI